MGFFVQQENVMYLNVYFDKNFKAWQQYLGDWNLINPVSSSNEFLMLFCCFNLFFLFCFVSVDIFF